MTVRVVLFALAFAPFVHAQTRPAAGLEPGAAQGQAKTRPLDPNLKFTHPPVEARGVWVASNDLLGPRDVLLRKFDRLKAANFNTVLIDAWFRGHTAYPGSAIAPEYPPLRGEDTLGVAIEEAHKRGLRAEPWVSYGFYAYWTTDATKDTSVGAILGKDPELASLDSQGRRVIHRNVGDFYSLCAANPKSHEILGQLMVEIVTKYPVDGLHLDRIRFPETDFCYCDYCKEHFKADTGMELKPFTKGSDDWQKWTEWKRQQTLAAVRHFEKVVHAAKPGLPITAYVIPPEEMDSRGQSWDLWAKEGLLDAVAVSMYGADIRPAADAALARLGPQAKSLLICAISADYIATTVYAQNVQIARQYSTLGQFTWFLGQLDDADFDALQAGPYEQPAADPLSQSATQRK
jgi:uncharacterized lipoprotein YddW (UPF0748 family)